MLHSGADSRVLLTVFLAPQITATSFGNELHNLAVVARHIALLDVELVEPEQLGHTVPPVADQPAAELIVGAADALVAVGQAAPPHADLAVVEVAVVVAVANVDGDRLPRCFLSQPCSRLILHERRQRRGPRDVLPTVRDVELQLVRSGIDVAQLSVLAHTRQLHVVGAGAGVVELDVGAVELLVRGGVRGLGHLRLEGVEGSTSGPHGFASPNTEPGPGLLFRLHFYMSSPAYSPGWRLVALVPSSWSGRGNTHFSRQTDCMKGVFLSPVCASCTHTTT
ncbi:hypothetical protein FH972_026239 [Carpinus fangiana]|uniref:Uncharacterized protein n=1 Tax=Carpinus fangiana TaxID=176857 RepID=A0A5N6L3X5_9ROSI|nr:hypothetical protein FH972_026239 [Carpinus fangiana]